MRISRYSLLLAAAGALGACTESSTTAPGVPPVGTVPATQQIAALQCTASPQSLTVSCSASTPRPTTGGSADLILGGQGQFVNLVSSNVGYDGAQFSFDATVQTLIPQPLATADGIAPDAQGVRVFFSSGPTVTAGTGSISVANADGTDAFTGTNQPYFQYTGTTLGADGILSQNETSDAKTWILNVDPTVSAFSFLVYVNAVVQHPKGYVNFSADSSVYALTDSAYVVAAQTHAFTAEVLSAAGLRRPGAVLAWSSSDVDVATVDANGTVTAVGPGTVTISAQNDTLVGLATLSVCPDLSVVGSIYVTSGADAGSVCLMSGAAVGEYVAVPYNGATSGSLPLSFVASGIQAVTGPPTPNLVPSTTARLSMSGTTSTTGGEIGGLTTDAAMVGSPHAAFDKKLRAFTPTLANRVRQPQSFTAQRVTSPEGEGITTTSGARTRLMWYPAATTTASADRLAPGGASLSITPGVPTVGDFMSLNVSLGSCNGVPDLRVGQVRTVSQRAIILSDTTNPPGGFTTAQYDSIGLEFDTVAYAVDTANFGGPTDIDGNGRVVIFYTRAVNEMSPPASSMYSTGFFALKDLTSSDPDAGCASSNQGEMLYMMVPDPTGSVNSNVRTVSFVRGQSGPTLVHNLTHLISASRRMYVVGGPLEEAWLDEGIANEALELAFYRTSFGLGPRQNVALSSLTTGPSASRRVAAFNTYQNNLFTYLRSWLQRPDTTGPLLHTPRSDLATGGALASSGSLWAFLRYSSDRVGGLDAGFWSSLVNSNLTGVANIQAAIGGADPYSWVRDFAVATYTDDAVSGMTPAYSQPSWNFRSVYGGLGGFPLGTRPLSNNTPLGLSFNYQAASYLRFGIAAGSRATLATTTTGALPSTMAMTIVRTK